MKHLALVLAGLLCAAAVPARAADALSLKGDMVQGGLIIGTVPPGTQVTLGTRKLTVDADGGFVFGFTRDAPAKATLKVVYPDGHAVARTLAVKARKYNIQRVNGLPENMVTPPKAVTDRIIRENKEIAAARHHDTPGTWYRDGFQWPAHGPISGVYGSQRILNGEPKQPHYGVDIAAPEGTPVHAPAGGIVRLAEKDLYLTGGTVILDHGYGVSSAFLHMRDVTVKDGQTVKTGDVIGHLGHAGRATGPHLDWRINWFDERIDAQLLVPPMKP